MSRRTFGERRDGGTRTPPKLASWLLSRLSAIDRRDGLIGDLVEEYQRGRSGAWYWRQTLQAIAAAALIDFRRRRWRWAIRLILIWGLLIGASVGAKWPIFLIALDPSLHFLLRHHARERPESGNACNV